MKLTQNTIVAVFLGILIGNLAVSYSKAVAQNRQSDRTLISEALSAYTLTMNSLGSIRIGMTVNEASRVSGYRLVMTYRTPDINLRSASDKICSVWRPLGGEEGVSFLATDNIIARINVSNSRISTLGGARVGDSKERILEMYSGRARVTGKTLSGRGEVITLFPSRPEDRNLRIVFETGRDGKVGYFRAGRVPEVNYIEGCL